MIIATWLIIIICLMDRCISLLTPTPNTVWWLCQRLQHPLYRMHAKCIRVGRDNIKNLMLTSWDTRLKQNALSIHNWHSEYFSEYQNSIVNSVNHSVSFPYFTSNEVGCIL